MLMQQSEQSQVAFHDIFSIEHDREDGNGVETDDLPMLSTVRSIHC
jgi:hypothetical protein